MNKLFLIKLILKVASSSLMMLCLFSAASSMAADELPSEVSPLVNSKSAAEAGESYFLINCQQCHDADGRGLTATDFISADLTVPDRFFYGATPMLIFRSVKYGAGLQMPPFRDSLEDETIWQIVAHIRNIGPEETRPQED